MAAEEKIKIPIYGGTLTIIKCDNIDEVKERFKLPDTKHIDALVIYEKVGEHIIIFEKGVNHGIVAHECLHVVTNIFEETHIWIDNDNDEPAAYLLEWIVNQYYNLKL